MKKRFTISGIEHMIRLLNQYPQLLSLSSLSMIREVGNKVKQAVERQKCNCAAGPIYAQNRNIFEASLNSLQNGDHLIVKSALNVDEICYYVKDSAGRLVLKCI